MSARADATPRRLELFDPDGDTDVPGDDVPTEWEVMAIEWGEWSDLDDVIDEYYADDEDEGMAEGEEDDHDYYADDEEGCAAMGEGEDNDDSDDEEEGDHSDNAGSLRHAREQAPV